LQQQEKQVPSKSVVQAKSKASIKQTDVAAAIRKAKHYYNH
jgi:hypothetical protein